MISNDGPVTPEARLYALDQLATRAGVQRDFWRKWKIQCGPDETVVSVGDGTRKRIRFKHAPRQFWVQLRRQVFQTAYVGWMAPPSPYVQRYVPGFIVPFAHEQMSSTLFTVAANGDVECSLDLLGSILLTLSRFEETLPGERDGHGRFTAAQSVAFQQGFLHRPIVDEYGLAFEQALACVVPGWTPTQRKLRVKVSHDIDHVGIPFRLRPTLGHSLIRHAPGQTLRDFLAPVMGLRPSQLDCVLRAINLSRNYGLSSTAYWKASPVGPMDSGYDPKHPKVLKTIAHLKREGVECGVHPGYQTFANPERLAQEVSILREALEEAYLGGRQHYLRWAPHTWMDWERCGLAYDSTLGFADHIGFRAGTCTPYRPWLLEENRQAELLEIPLAIMDVTLNGYMGHRRLADRYCLIGDCIARCELVGGVFTLLWHNDRLLDRADRATYEWILAKVSGSTGFDWREALANGSWSHCQRHALGA